MIKIPDVPTGVVDENNLYNDVYGDRSALRWTDPAFQARLQWIGLLCPFSIEQWYAPVNQTPFSAPLRLSTMFTAKLPDGQLWEVDVLNVWLNPELVLMSLRKLKDGAAAQFLPYPGDAAAMSALEPEASNPVGAAWLDHPWTWRRLFHDKGGDRFAVGAQYDTPTAKYQKVGFLLRPAPLGGTAPVDYAWELVYDRRFTS